MDTKVLPYNRTQQEEQEILLFYVERILELVEKGCISLAKAAFERNKSKLRSLLSEEIFNRLKNKTQEDLSWNQEKEKSFYERMEHAWSFGEHKSVHDLGHEILFHHNHKADSCPTHDICNEVLERLAANSIHYIEPDSIAVNTFIDATIQFVVENRRPNRDGVKNLEGNPGFYLHDVMDRRYRCFVKQLNEVQVGEMHKLKITNIPGPALTNGKKSEPIVYLEPRVAPGDLIEVELNSLSHTGNSFTFRHYSYDGFLWFKRRGVNKEIFNKNTLQPQDRIVAKVLYTTEEEKRTHSGKVTRLGIIKAIPIRRAEQEPYPQEDQDNGAAKVLN